MGGGVGRRAVDGLSWPGLAPQGGGWPRRALVSRHNAGGRHPPPQGRARYARRSADLRLRLLVRLVLSPGDLNRGGVEGPASAPAG